MNLIRKNLDNKQIFEFIYFSDICIRSFYMETEGKKLYLNQNNSGSDFNRDRTGK